MSGGSGTDETSQAETLTFSLSDLLGVPNISIADLQHWQLFTFTRHPWENVNRKRWLKSEAWERKKKRMKAGNVRYKTRMANHLKLLSWNYVPRCHDSTISPGPFHLLYMSYIGLTYQSVKSVIFLNKTAPATLWHIGPVDQDLVAILEDLLHCPLNPRSI